MISEILKNISKEASHHSPAILAGVGVAGVIATSVLTGKATYHAANLLRDIELENNQKLTKKEIVNVVWPQYIPAVVAGVGTSAAIIMSTRIGMRRTAAMTAAFTLSEKAANEYREKVIEHIGKAKNVKIEDDLAQDRINRSKANPASIIMTGQEQLCYDSWSSRYFTSTMEDLKKAQNDLNHRIISDDYASLSDFYDLLNLEHTQESDDIGWNVDRLLELEYSTCISPDQRPAISIRYRVLPTREYHRLH